MAIGDENLRQHGRETILINLKVTIPLTTDIRLRRNRQRSNKHSEVKSMNSPELPDRLAPPTIDDSLLELDGTTYKELSHSAAAKRAAYHEAMSAKLLASSSNTPTHEQTSSAASTSALLNRVDWFVNYGTAPDYTTQGGTQGPGQEGWIMHSQGSGDSSRLKFNFPFNDGSAPYTMIRAWMRGAPDNGKNSYVTLIEQRCAEESQSLCDEIDLVEYYGQSSRHRSEFTIYQNGTNGNVGTQVWPAPTDPGLDMYSYTVYLERGNYMSWTLQAPDGLTLGKWDRHISQAYVPAQPMYLYVGIWDCSSREGSQGWCFDPPGPFTGDSWMALQGLYYDTGGSVLQRYP